MWIYIYIIEWKRDFPFFTVFDFLWQYFILCDIMVIGVKNLAKGRPSYPVR